MTLMRTTDLTKRAWRFPLLLLVISLLCPQVLAQTTLRVCDDVAGPASLNPYQVFSEKAHTLLQQMLEGLVRFQPDGKIEPALALKWKRIDPFTMRFFLRKGVTFHNGEPFNAQAVKFSLERYVDSAIRYPGYGFVQTIKSVEIIDDYTVDVKTVMPDGLLLRRLAAWLHIVPPAYFAKVGDEGFKHHPVGTGPFAFESWTDHAVTMKANRSYWMTGYPKVDRLVFLFAPPDEQATMLRKGEADLVTELPGTFTTEMKQDNLTIAKQSTYWTVGATMKIDSGPLADVRVRRALNLAINRADLIRYDNKGNGTVLASLTMEGEEGHNPDLIPYPYDPQQARKLLAEAGVKTPLVLKTLIRAQGARTASILAAQFRKIGVILDIAPVYTDSDVIEGLKSQKWDIAIAGLPDPMCNSFFIQSILLYSQSPFSLEHDKAFDGKLGMFMTSLDDAQRDHLGRELDRFVYDQALSLFTYQKIKTYGLSNKVNFKPYISGMPYFFATSMKPSTLAPAQAAANTDPH